jgi:Concanavalin A-like lectin/glucanases superfamily
MVTRPPPRTIRRASRQPLPGAESVFSMCRRFDPHAPSSAIRWLCLCALCAVVCAQAAWAQTPPPPILLSEESSTRAISLDSVTHAPEPFAPDSPVAWGADGRTRVEVFAMNLALQPGEAPTAVTAGAEDAAGRRYELKVEYVGPVQGFEWMSAVILRLDDDMGDVGDVLVWLTYHGATSNRVRVAIGHTGGGPPDDAGAVPTPPRLVSGRVTKDGNGFGGVTLLLSGSQTATLTTAPDGSYSFVVAPLGDYTLTPQFPFFDFDPPSQSFLALRENRLATDFSAARQTRAISGQILDESGRKVSGYALKLTGGQTSDARSSLTDGEGRFSFTGVPAGFNYVVAPGDINILTFAPVAVNALASDVTLSVEGTRQLYSLKGRVTDYAGGVAGASVELKGQGLKATTDASGAYHFDGLPAGLPYAADVSDPDYIFEQAELSVGSLAGDTEFDFRAAPHFVLSGKVTDASGKGILGIFVTLGGAGHASTVTDMEGKYSLTATVHGDFTLTCSKEQGFYSFDPPVRSLPGLGTAQEANFVAALDSKSDPSYVLEFDGSPKTVDYSFFWPWSGDLGHFYWEFWAMPGADAGGTYMLSDGYGAAHALLFGFGFFGASEPGRYQLFGDIWDSTNVIFFSSDEGPTPGEWGHYAVGWDGQYIVTYFNGVPVGRGLFLGPRRTPGPIGGSGRLYIGGSNHNNFVGRIAQVRGYEGTNPREAAGGSVYGPFAPQTVFGVDGNLLSWYFRRGDSMADLSYGQGGQWYSGLLRGWIPGVIEPCVTCPRPEFVIDPTAPNFADPAHPGQPAAPVESPAAVPQGALAFDSFSRRNSTYALGGAGGLGSTEGGSAGPLAWHTGVASTSPQPFGILNGRAVLLANSAAVAWVEAGSRDLGVSVERRPKQWGSGQNTGLSFRVADASDYFFAYTSEGVSQTDPKTLTVGYYLGGARTDLVTGLSLPTPQSPWITLRVVTRSDGTILVYVDGTLVYSNASGVLSNATGAGLYNNAPGLGLTNRWDNFTISAAP